MYPVLIIICQKPCSRESEQYMQDIKSRDLDWGLLLLDEVLCAFLFVGPPPRDVEGED